MTKEDKEVLKNCWVMTTDHVLDEENKKLKNVIEKVLEENMTAEEKSSCLLCTSDAADE